MSVSELKVGQPLPVSTGYSPETIVIKPSRGWVGLDLQELRRYRELLFFMTWRDIKVRYKQTALGISWAIIQPFMTMVVFSIFFGNFAGMPSDDVPYPIFSYAALVPWTFFQNGLTHSSNSLVAAASMVKKVYFPRIILPLATIMAGLVDFVLSFAVLLVMMLFFGIVPTANIIWLPFLVLLAAITALGVGLWLSALNVKYRDVKHILPFLAQIWMFATPIAYSSSIVPSEWKFLYALNPMMGVVEGFRWALLGVDTAPGGAVLASTIAALVILFGGAFYFRRMERSFADIV